MSSIDRKSVVHVITGLPVGGAQSVLYRLITNRDRVGCDIRVISLTELGEVGEQIRRQGIDVRALGMSRSLPSPAAVVRLTTLIRSFAPDIVQTWLYHGDLIGGIAARLARVPALYWNLRQTDLDPAGTKRATMLTARACALLSHRLPDRIVCCAEAARRVHAAIGYDEKRMQVIDNGVDTDHFRPDPAARKDLRAELGIKQDESVVGLMARFHPQKDHASFLAAAGSLHQALPNVHFVLCGEAIAGDNADIARMIDSAGIRSRVHLLGLRSDVARLNAVFDVAVSSSSSEGFSNTAIEAMACGIPCVVTDVGESARIVGETGWVVPKKDPKALAAALEAALSQPREMLYRRGIAARERVLEHFSLETMLSSYRRLYAGDIAPAVRRPA